MNNKSFLHEVITYLENNGITTWIFGGWAEELSGITKPHAHKDIDLLYPAEDFKIIDSLLSKNSQVREIPAKRFYHKRAFLYKDVLIELLLVQKDSEQLYTKFWGKHIFYWPTNALCHKDGSGITSESALLHYRRTHEELMKVG